MGKNSARSKGYRKEQPKKTSGYTQSEKRIMTIGFLVIVLVIVGVLVVPDWLESFHLLKVKDGVIQGMGDNWLVCNMSASSSNPKYRKLAEFNGIEGYELTSKNYLTDENMPYYIYGALNDDAAAETLMVQAGNGEASELAENYYNVIGNYTEVLYRGEVQQDNIDGRDVWYCAVEYRTEHYDDSEQAAADDETASDSEEEPEEEKVYDYSQSVILYVDSLIDGKSVVLTAGNDGQSEDDFRDRDAMIELVRAAVSGVELSK